VLDVINKQLLVLHLVFEPEPNERKNFVGLGTIVKGIQKLQDLFVYMLAVANGIFDRWP
jgi:hypothetical protein